jgi:hypothetical protein
VDIQNDLEYLYKNQADDKIESSDSEDENIMTMKRNMGAPKTKKIKKKSNKDRVSKKVKLNIDFEDENEEETAEKLKQLETN